MLMKFVADIKLEVLPTLINLENYFKREIGEVRIIKKKK